MERSNPKSWQAVLTPHRSLTRTGFLAIMGLVAVINLILGGLFAWLGAWPVAGFAGLDLLLIWWAFRANFADARKMERICITEHELTVDRYGKGSATDHWRFVRRWVRVELEEDRDRDLVGRLSLVSGRSRVEIGDFLAPDERRTLAEALRKALANPRV